MTIGAGVDLSMTQASEMNSYGVPAAIIDALSDWMVAPGDGPSAVAQYGYPTLSTADAGTLSGKIFIGDAFAVAGHWNAQSTQGIDFFALPNGAQTALVDASYPNGPNLAGAGSPYARAMWGDALAGNWTAVAAEFRSWKDSNGVHENRYTLDANDIQAMINRSYLPANGTKGLCPKQ